MCVTLGVIGMLLHLFYCRGTQHFTGTVSNEATSEMGYPAWPAGRTCNFPFPSGKRLSQEPRCFNVLIFSLHCRCERIAVSLFVRRSFSSFWALLPLEDLQDPVVRTCTLRKWNPRPACGTAFSSVHNISSVFGLVPTRDEPAECLQVCVFVYL